jgi:hypothetical protein
MGKKKAKTTKTSKSYESITLNNRNPGILTTELSLKNRQRKFKKYHPSENLKSKITVFNRRMIFLELSLTILERQFCYFFINRLFLLVEKFYPIK